MKKPLLLASLLVVLLSNNIFSQSSKYGWLCQESWDLGFGFAYPRYIATDLRGGDFGSYGMFLSIKRNFSEHFGFRLQSNYLHIADRQSVFLSNQNSDNNVPKVENDILLASLGMVYYFSPCEPISPYAGIGAGGVYYRLKNSPIVVTATASQSRPLDKAQTDYELDAFMGAEWRVAENWKLKTEFGYHNAASGKFDGVYGTSTGGGILGGHGDTYMTFDLGLVYYFGYGEKSHICEIYEGINSKVDYDKIEEIVKRYKVQPSEVDYNKIEEIVKKYRCASPPAPTIPPVPKDNWVLVGVNFDFNKATLKPESIPILNNAVEILLGHPDVKVEIQGHTDNVGSDQHNQILSLQRALAVRNYLIAKGVAANRLTTIGYGKTKPIMDNKTEYGRSMNRRIELKVIK
ncbi:MAG: OmpA family protein [Ignavibacteriaceae bacterium]|nr:OmpA family protein [Ignavibacteriaceae bacterium]